MMKLFRKISLPKLASILNLAVLAAIVVIVAIIGYNVFFTDIFGSETGRVLRNRFIEPVLKKVDVSYVFFNAESSDLPVYEIIISPKNYKKLLSARQEKLKDPFFSFPYVKAKFIHEGKEYDVRVKLRGLLPNHWMEKKKSWRVKFPDETLFNGQKRLNLIIPADRDYIKEHLAYYTARKFGLITPESKFVLLKINGRLQGVYFQVEQMGKEFLAHNLQAEDSDLYEGEDKKIVADIFKDLAYWDKIRSERVSGFDNYADIYKLLDLLNQSDDETFYSQLPQLVDMDKLFSWNANSMLYFDYHQNNYHNVRLLFSPVTGRFEPLVWDCSHPIFVSHVDKIYNDLITRVLKNPVYLHKRNQILWDYVSDPENLREDQAFFDKTYGSIRTAFLADSQKNISNLRFLYVMRRIRGDLESYYNHIKSKLGEGWVHIVTHYNVDQPGVYSRLEVLCGGFSAPRLDGIAVKGGEETCELYYDKNGDGVLQKTDVRLGNSAVPEKGSSVIDDIGFMLYPGREAKEGSLVPVSGKYDFFLVSAGGEKKYKEIEVRATNAVTAQKIEPVVKAVDDSNFKYFDLITSSPAEFAKRYDFIGAGAEKSAFTIETGEHDINETVIVPRGLTLEIKPGAVLKFAPGVSLISYGKVIARGSKGSRIRFRPKDGNTPWGVFAVVNEGADGSVFSNVHVSGGYEAFINGIYFTGALAVHGAEALVSDCVFEDNSGDDALNIKHRTGRLRRSVFRNNKFDAVDYDFVKEGAIEDCRFKGNGNDAIDIGSASPIVMNNVIEESGDKGISCGERSSPLIFNNRISGCDIGIAVKDDSRATILNCDIIGNKKGITSYIKKPLWIKAGTIYVYNSILKNEQELELLDDASITIRNSFISEESYRDKNNKVWAGKGWGMKDIKDLPVDIKITSEYFPDIDKKGLRLGAF